MRQVGEAAPGIVTVPLAQIIERFAPGSRRADPDGGPWTWDHEEEDILARTCCCRSHECESPSPGPQGHYQKMLEAHISERAIPGGVDLGYDGRVWDGNHRIVAARRLGIEEVPVEDDSPGLHLLATPAAARR